MISFIDRKSEISALEKDWNSQKNGFTVVYGRRRIGKTRLLLEFLKDKEGAKFTAEDTKKKIQTRDFKEILADYFNDDFLREQEISDWKILFSYLSKIIKKDKKFYIWVDEFSYLIKNDSSFASKLQKFIDNFVRNSNLFIFVSGSIFGLMSEKVLSSSSPLYGRRTRDILLESIPAKDTRKFLDMNFKDFLKVNLTIGGVPEYLKIASKYKNYSTFIESEFLRKEGYFYREPFFLLSQEFKEIKTYFSIINAIAYGNTKPTEIANFVGIETRGIYPYLELLISYGFVKREVPVVGSKKKGIYLIKDVFFDFWFFSVHRKREMIEAGTAEIRKKDLNTYLGKRFEMFIRDNFQIIESGYNKFGRWWHKDKEIDIVALGEDKILFGECKWKEKVDALKVISELKEKAKDVKWGSKNRKEKYVVFAKSFKEKLKGCYDLVDLEKFFK